MGGATLLSLWTAVAYAQGYQVGAGDTLRVQVFDEPELSRESVVSPRCAIDVELIGSVDVCGRGPVEIADEIERRLGASFLANPEVIVEVSTYGSQKVEVRGAVATPGIQVLMGPTPLSEIITKAGGPKGENVVDVEVVSPDGHTSTYALSGLIVDGQPITIVAGQTVIVRQGRYVYVDGEVEKACSVPFREGLTVTQAISLAGGPGQFASKRRAHVVSPGGGRVSVNLARIRRGRDEDLVLQPDDRVTLLHAFL